MIAYPLYPSSPSLLGRVFFELAKAASPALAERHRIFREVMESQGALVARICFSFATGEVEYDDLRQEAWLNI